jgi:hypothetical protein
VGQRNDGENPIKIFTSLVGFHVQRCFFINDFRLKTLDKKEPEKGYRRDIQNNKEISLKQLLFLTRLYFNNANPGAKRVFC